MQLEQLACKVLVEAARLRLPHTCPLGPLRHVPRQRHPPSIRVGVGVHPVVEIEEHRRAPGDRFEHLAEAAEDVGPDGVALEGGDVGASRALAGEHVEVVEPEVHEHFLELALAVDGAEESGLFHLRDDLPVFLLGRAQFPPERAAGPGGGRNRCRRGIGRLRRGLSLPRPAFELRRLVVIAKECVGIERQGDEPGKPSLERAVGDALGMELLVEPGLDPHPLDAREVAGARAIGQAIEDVCHRGGRCREGG